MRDKRYDSIILPVLPQQLDMATLRKYLEEQQKVLLKLLKLLKTTDTSS